MNDAATEYQALQTLAERHRRELQLGVRDLQELLTASRAVRTLLKRSRPLLPYAATTAGVALLVILLRRGRAPPALIAAGAAVDALRIWVLLRHR